MITISLFDLRQRFAFEAQAVAFVLSFPGGCVELPGRRKFNGAHNVHTVMERILLFATERGWNAHNVICTFPAVIVGRWDLVSRVRVYNCVNGRATALGNPHGSMVAQADVVEHPGAPEQPDGFPTGVVTGGLADSGVIQVGADAYGWLTDEAIVFEGVEYSDPGEEHAARRAKREQA